MAKRDNQPSSPEADEVNEALILLGELMLTEHFFDPDQEREYKQKLSARRQNGGQGVLLAEDTFELPDGDCGYRIKALRDWSQFRIELTNSLFTASVEGTWNFETADLRRAKVEYDGDPETIEMAALDMMDELEGAGLDEEEFASFIEGISDADDEVPLIGDDPSEPPEATGLDRGRVRAIARRLGRKPSGELDVEERGWLEQTPQTLPVIVEFLIAAASAEERDEGLIFAYQTLLAEQLEFVRYRQDRGWGWADDMIQAFQQRLIVLGREAAISREDWFKMCQALTEARVPLSDPVQIALADAGFNTEDSAEPPEQMLRALRGFLDELAAMVSSPFEVTHSLRSAGAMLPAMLRRFMAMELALSPHQVLRDAVPLMLLDEDADVRKGAAMALKQTARPETMSGDALRRAITVRNWVPAADRPPLDAVIRKARLAGIEIAAWPAPYPDLEFHATAVDGSAAQSIFAVSRSGKKKGLFGGVLLRHGTGVIDTWADADQTVGKINKLLREAQSAAACARVDKSFADKMIEHAIGTAVEQQTVPPALLLEMAELLGGTEWKDRRLDIRSEAEHLFAGLDPADRTPVGVESGLLHGMDWIAKDAAFSSWFEDGPDVQKALGKLSRTDQPGIIAAVMNDILPGKRAEWAERFLAMALWSQARSDPKERPKARDLVLIAHALAGETPLSAIPAMSVIAVQTMRAMLLGGW